MSVATQLAPTIAARHSKRSSTALTSGRQKAGVGGWIVLALLLAFAIGPLLVFVFASLKTQSELAENPLGLPSQLLWSNFADAWNQAHMGQGLLNSFIIVTGTVAGVTAISALAAYSMARLDLPGGGAVITYLLVTSALPMQMFLVPLFYLWTQAGLYDSLTGLIIIYIAVFSPFATLLLRAFLLSLPKELEEAARIDGASEVRIALQVVLPNAVPGLLTVALVTALTAYNEFLFAVTFLQDSALMPVSTAFFSFQTSYVQNGVLNAAAGIIMLLPMLVLFLALQRRFVDGLANTGMGS